VPAHFTVRGRWPVKPTISWRADPRGAPVDGDAWQAAIERACAAWTATGLVAFVPADDGADADVTLSWRRGHHGACEPFGTGDAVAHSGWPKSGTYVHFDADRAWSAGADAQGYPLYGTALHELGHVLGLGHSAADDAVMRTGVVREVPLSRHELQGLQSMYGGGEDRPGDLLVDSADGKRRCALRGVAPVGVSSFCVFDADGDERDDVLVWRTDREGNGALMIYHFMDGAGLQRTTGPYYGMSAPGATHRVLRTDDGQRLFVARFDNGRVVARHFDERGALHPFGGEVDGALLAMPLPVEGDLDGDGEVERVHAF